MELPSLFNCKPKRNIVCKTVQTDKIGKNMREVDIAIAMMDLYDDFYRYRFERRKLALLVLEKKPELIRKRFGKKVLTRLTH